VSGTALNILLVLVLILIGGFFAAAEMALISMRESQVKALTQDPKRARRAERVAKLHKDPNRFLAAVQIGVTLAGFLSAAVGGATLADDLAPVLEDWGVPAGISGTIALISITLLISYFSLVLGELAPKRVALQRAEGLSLLVAPVLDRLATLSRPIIWLLSASTDVVVRLVGADPKIGREEITEEELRDLVAGHRTLGERERELIDEVFAAGERQIREVMVPRTEVEFVDASTPVFKAVKMATAKPHSRYPVVRGSHDDVLGFVHVRDLFDPDLSGRSVRVGDLARDVMLLPATKRVLPALSEMQRDGQHLAIVIDEYGGTAGIVTLEDLVEELVGDIRDEYDVGGQQPARRLGTGDIEVDGLLNLEDFTEETGITLPEGPYETVAGYVISRLGHVAEIDEQVEVDGHRLTVIERDGRRISKVRVSPLPRERPEPVVSPVAEPPAS
jgi:magnesium and cobalt exporter, CNNM family